MSIEASDLAPCYIVLGVTRPPVWTLFLGQRRWDSVWACGSLKPEAVVTHFTSHSFLCILAKSSWQKLGPQSHSGGGLNFWKTFYILLRCLGCSWPKWFQGRGKFRFTMVYTRAPERALCFSAHEPPGRSSCVV